MRTVYCCWDCGKEYPPSIYPPYDELNKLVLCECGGQVVSNSGKVLIKRIFDEEKEEFRQENEKFRQENERLKELIQESLVACSYCPNAEGVCGESCSIRKSREFFIKNNL